MRRRTVPGTATCVRLAAISEVYSEADISRVADPAGRGGRALPLGIVEAPVVCEAADRFRGAELGGEVRAGVFESVLYDALIGSAEILLEPVVDR